ncbi:MAG: hypothetical protein EBS09_00150 [Flavobacteriia bacterium]|nr:hypothetical protein [Flavobacteriia bacterium]
MKVHLIRASGYPLEDFNNVINLLRKHRGSIEFVPSEPIVLPDSDILKIFEDRKEFEKKEMPPIVSLNSTVLALDDSFSYSFPLKEPVYTWQQLFGVCTNFRKESMIPKEDHVILLTNESNEHNWFGSYDESLRNYFIQTNHWGYFFGNDLDSRFPIAYEVAAWILRSMMFAGQAQTLRALHKEPRGCMMDFCIDKSQIILKMRTGDLCQECMNILTNRDVNRSHARQLFTVMDGIRENLLFRQRSSLLMENSRMEIRGLSKRIFLTDLGDLEINLNPKERALYLLYLNHPEGIMRSHLVDHKVELRSYYAMFSHQASNQSIDEAIDRLTDVTDNNMNEVMARIRKNFKQAVGQQQFEDYGIMATPEGRHKIRLNRELVKFIP